MPIQDISAWCLGVSGAISGTVSLDYLQIGKTPTPACIRRNLSGTLVVSERYPENWPPIAPLSGLQLPELRDKLNELILAFNRLIAIHLE